MEKKKKIKKVSISGMCIFISLQGASSVSLFPSHVSSCPLLHSKGLHQPIIFSCSYNVANYNSNKQSKSIPNQNYFPTKFEERPCRIPTLIRNEGEVGEESETQHFFDNGFPHKPRFPTNELFSNVSNCFPCGIELVRLL